MTIVSSTDTPAQVNQALEAHGYEPIPEQITPVTEQTPTPATSAPDPAPDAAAPSADGTTVPASEPGSTEPVQAPGKKKAWYYDRIKELSDDKKELRAEIERLRAKVEGTPPAQETAAAPPPAQPQKPVRPKFPRASEYETVEEHEAAMAGYETALEKYETDLAEYTRQQAVSDVQRDRQRQEAQDRLEAAHEAGMAAHPDYQEKVIDNSDVPVSPALLDAIFKTENPQEIFYWLGTHPEEARQFAAETGYDPKTEMSKSWDANRLAGMIVRDLEYQTGTRKVPGAPVAAPVTPAPVPAPKPRQTAAPAPISPLRGSGGTAPAAPDARTRVVGQNGWTAAMERQAMAEKRR